MKKFMVIGLGNFGAEVVKSLFKMGNEVIGVDKDSDKVQRIRDFSSRAVIADAEDKDFLLNVGAGEMDAVVVSMGDNVSQSIITTLLLREIGVRYIIAKANDQQHGKALKKIGAGRVIYPEQEVAIKLARQLNSPSVIDSLDLTEDYMMTELLAPLEFVGKSLEELNLRKLFDVFVVAIREAVPERFTVLPKGDFRIKDSDVLLLLGRASDIATLEKKAAKAKK
jgi:trk system potassium uptake protein TrkA